jgi:hypothetical protein
MIHALSEPNTGHRRKGNHFMPPLCRHKRISELMIILALCGGVSADFLLSPSAVAGPIIYVDADAAGIPEDGSAWCSAFRTLSEAMTIATPGTTIRVANGTYSPDPTLLTDPREATFQLLSGVVIEGGFAGCEADNPHERDLVKHETILSGDLNGDDGPFLLDEFLACFSGADAPLQSGCEAHDFDLDGDVDPDDIPQFLVTNNYAENSYHVVTGSATDLTAVLDGITITAGNANGDSASHNRGGGMYNNVGHPTLQDCTFAGNSASQRGGGMFNTDTGTSPTGSHPELISCTFRDNFVTEDGGGMYNNRFSRPELTSCTFTDNRAGKNGGGMYNSRSSPTLTDCIFEYNATINGGGMYSANGCSSVGGIETCTGSQPILVTCRFERNSASNSGGGMYNKGQNTDPRLTDCIFRNNEAGANGGGMYSRLDSGPRLTGTACSFIENSARNGGGMYNLGSSPSLTGCSFVENLATNNGGGMYNKVDRLTTPPLPANPTLTSCAFRENAAVGWGGGIYDRGSTPLRTNSRLTNCLFSRNVANSGGGMFTEFAQPLLTNCTFAVNLGGGGIWSTSQSIVAVANCVLWGNVRGGSTDQSAQVGTDGTGTVSISHSCVQNLSDALLIDGNIRDDPLFRDAESDNLRLLCSSPCNDAGDNDQYNSVAPGDESDCNGNQDFTEVFPCDLGRGPRFFDAPDPAGCSLEDEQPELGTTPVIDMGAYEFGDCNNNGTPDSEEIENQPHLDCNANGLPDVCEISVKSTGGPFFCVTACDPDCNDNGIPDACDIDETDADGDGYVSGDCQPDGAPGAGIPDECDIANGACDRFDAIGPDDGIPGDGIPDECQTLIGDIFSEWISQDDCDLPDECLWSDGENWCPAEAPENAVGVMYQVTVMGAQSLVRLDDVFTIRTLSLGAGSVIQADEAGSAALLFRPLSDSVNAINAGTIRVVSAESVHQELILDLNDMRLTQTSTGVLEARGTEIPTILRLQDSTVTGGTLRSAGTGSIRLGTNAIISARGSELVIIDASVSGATVNNTIQGLLEACDGRIIMSPNAEVEVLAVAIRGDGSGTSQVTVCPDAILAVAGALSIDGTSLSAPAAAGGCTPAPPNGAGEAGPSAAVLGCDPPPPEGSTAHLTVVGFASVEIGGSLSIIGVAGVSVEGTVTLIGDFDNQSAEPDIFEWSEGSLTMDGGGGNQVLEAAGMDRGPDPSGFDGNFAIGRLELTDGTLVTIADGFDNQPDDDKCEALYVDRLILGAKARLVCSCPVYFERLSGNVAGLCPEAVQIPTGDFEGDGDVDLDDFAAYMDCVDYSGTGAITLESGCGAFDFDLDQDLDLADLGYLQLVFGQ